MKRFILTILVSAAFLAHHDARAQEYGDVQSGAFGYTSIDFDPTTNVVTAYSETDLFGGGPYYYQATVELRSNGLDYWRQSANPSSLTINVTMSYAGSSGTTYTATGAHSAYISTKFFGGALNDPYGFQRWAAFDIDSAYRNPAREYTAATNSGGRYAPGSRHQYGDAIDVATSGNQTTWQEYVDDGHSLGGCAEPYSVQRNYGHTHIDWRTLATTGQTWTRCPTNW
jgi:hypothetical protein